MMRKVDQRPATAATVRGRATEGDGDGEIQSQALQPRRQSRLWPTGYSNWLMASRRPDLEFCPECLAKMEQYVDWRLAENRAMNITLRLVSQKAEEVEEAEPAALETASRCPVCAYLIRGNDSFVEQCERCGVIAHEVCFWRALPIEEWLLYIRWREEGPRPSVYSRGPICAECRRLDDK
jgi:hypothetical protein